jgi:hypothetical protein
LSCLIPLRHVSTEHPADRRFNANPNYKPKHPPSRTVP